ncbi:PREDICTED: poly(U)-specific endoribonuclease homolog [Nicrophorus vespilloides]|uniref:Poly(U)-specific endoribonuclease homolog n=1 Tax=Nicrophorus vespilloides TaxID=110193 RepID=A0ABM1MJZ9_NICVS|nr:PREDICTED: poly(U)-specific endoribonuclease homolog [Nicrophorus vespilloides]
MAVNLNYITSLFIALCLLVINIYCADLLPSNPNPNNSVQFKPNQDASHSSTTPWPELGQRRPYRPNNMPNNMPSSSTPPTWVRPVQGGTRDFVNPLIKNVPTNYSAPVWVRPTPPSTQPIRDFVSSPKTNLVGPNPTTPKSPTQMAPIQPNRDFVSSPRTNAIAPGPTTPKPTSSLKQTEPKIDFVNSKFTTAKPIQTAIRDFVLNERGTVKPAVQNPKQSVTSTTQKPISSSGPTTPKAGKISEDDELREFSETLWKKDVNSALKYITINYQGKTRSSSSKDEAPEPLFTIHPDAFKIPSIEKLLLLHNNYILDSSQNEVYTAQEKIEENNFLDTILSTPVMQHTRNFLIKKGKLSRDPKQFKDLLKQYWFNMYSRGGGRIGSSGFEHVFLAEIKNDAVSGLHNWIFFNQEEKKNKANYLGYMKKIEFDKGALLKYHFKFHNIDKPVGTLFIGSSPELEIALYSTCFILRPDDACPVRAAGNNYAIRTHSYRYRGKNMIGSAYLEI